MIQDLTALHCQTIFCQSGGKKRKEAFTQEGTVGLEYKVVLYYLVLKGTP